MLLWPLLALMTAAAVFAVLWPLSRRRENPDPLRESGLAVYRDQFAEIERDRARNLIGEAEAKFARTEVGRRLLAADDQIAAMGFSQNSTARRRAVALIALAGIPIVAVGLYLLVGSPQLSGAPLSSRLAAAPENQDIALLLRRVEAHLAEQPDDGRGWEILAPVYLRTGRTEDAVKARANALSLRRCSATPLRGATRRTLATARNMTIANTMRSMRLSQRWPMPSTWLEIGAKALALSRNAANHVSHSIAQR